MIGNSTRLPSPDDFSLRHKLAQLIFVRVGSNLPPIRMVEDDEARITELLKTCPVGGLLLFNGGPATSLSLERLQLLARWPLLVAADIERGVGQQVRGQTTFPHAMAFDRLGEQSATAVAEFARVSAQEAHDVGIHISFSPVADVNTNPRNPIIATRAFSSDPTRAAELAAAYVKSAEQAGLCTCAKHFPGHGDTHQDSHDSLPVVDRTLDELRARELQPFQAAIDAGCALLMTAHVAFPKIDPTGVPATLSSILLKQLLRDEMSFQGVVCSDSLLMAGVRDRFASEGAMALATINAGVDMLLDIREPSVVVDYLAMCVEEGSLDEERVEEAFERVWSLKSKALAPLANGDASSDDRARIAAAEVARNAIEIFGSGDRDLLPLDADRPLAAILLKTFELPTDPPEQPLADALRERFGDVRYLQLGPRAGPAEFAAAAGLARERPQLLVAMIVKPAAWHAFGLLPSQREFVQQLTRERDVVLVSLGVPQAFDDYPHAATRICTYSDVPVSQQALAEFIAP